MTIQKAKSLLMGGEVERASRVLMEITDNDSGDEAAWLLLCGISIRTEDWELGIKSFYNLICLRPRSALASSGLVQSYCGLGRYEDALREIERFESIVDESDDEHRSVLSEYKKIKVDIYRSMGSE